MNKYLACSPNYDDTHWFEVESFDPQMAAEDAAQLLCDGDPEFYRCFEHGETILVKSVDNNELMGTFTVYVESVPHFSAVEKT